MINKKSKIFIGSDHAGFKLKKEITKFLAKNKYEFEDIGPYEYDGNDDYPDYAVKVCEKILETGGKGILICSSGQGMSIVANKIPGIYAIIGQNENSAKASREHYNVNVLCLGEKILKKKYALKIVKIWLETPFISKIKYVRKLEKIRKIERKQGRDKVKEFVKIAKSFNKIGER